MWPSVFAFVSLSFSCGVAGFSSVVVGEFLPELVRCRLVSCSEASDCLRFIPFALRGRSIASSVMATADDRL